MTAKSFAYACIVVLAIVFPTSAEESDAWTTSAVVMGGVSDFRRAVDATRAQHKPETRPVLVVDEAHTVVFAVKGDTLFFLRLRATEAPSLTAVNGQPVKMIRITGDYVFAFGDTYVPVIALGEQFAAQAWAEEKSGKHQVEMVVNEILERALGHE